MRAFLVAALNGLSTTARDPILSAAFITSPFAVTDPAWPPPSVPLARHPTSN